MNTIYNEENVVGRLLVIYSIFSSYSFIVNLYLGLRFFNNNNKLLDTCIDITRILAFYSYIISCSINWIIQLYILNLNIIIGNISFGILLYIFLLIIIINDDIILIKWLRKKQIKLE